MFLSIYVYVYLYVVSNSLITLDSYDNFCDEPNEELLIENTTCNIFCMLSSNNPYVTLSYQVTIKSQANVCLAMWYLPIVPIASTHLQVLQHTLTIPF